MFSIEQPKIVDTHIPRYDRRRRSARASRSASVGTWLKAKYPRQRDDIRYAACVCVRKTSIPACLFARHFDRACISCPGLFSPEVSVCGNLVLKYSLKLT